MDKETIQAILKELREIKQQIELLNKNLPNIPSALNTIADKLSDLPAGK